MNFLELVQRVARESGTIPGENQPASVVGTTGRLARMVHWTNDAWRGIQRSRTDWRWMQGEFEGSLTAGSARYTSASFNLTRFARWRVNGPTEDRFSLYDPTIGVTDEGQLIFVPWDTFYVTKLRGSIDANRPAYFSVSPAREFVVSPTPDKTYTVRGPYQKSAQTLTANTDIPEMPEDFHDLIVWEALKLMGIYDEATVSQPFWSVEAIKRRSELLIDQLPRITTAGPLA